MKERELHLFTADLLRRAVRPGVLSLHIANEGARSPRTGAYLKRMGRLSPAQDAFRWDSFDAGCPYAICRTPEAVQKTLEEWDVIRSVETARAAA